ncbi:helix-turn-helix domain-containing protein [Streptomyces sp. NPDC058947]|uniref:helix-turn-helix domain-containing protein n=1 Tax=Streptomyces sp. NPDC058947 TaxID=3346675 RepID=UPI00367A52EC
MLDADRELFTTAKPYLDRAGDARAAAAELGLHRASMYHRVRRIEDITRLDLSDGQHRLLLHLASRSPDSWASSEPPRRGRPARQRSVTVTSAVPRWAAWYCDGRSGG